MARIMVRGVLLHTQIGAHFWARILICIMIGLHAICALICMRTTSCGSHVDLISSGMLDQCALTQSL